MPFLLRKLSQVLNYTIRIFCRNVMTAIVTLCTRCEYASSNYVTCWDSPLYHTRFPVRSTARFELGSVSKK